MLFGRMVMVVVPLGLVLDLTGAVVRLRLRGHVVRGVVVMVLIVVVFVVMLRVIVVMLHLAQARLDVGYEVSHLEYIRSGSFPLNALVVPSTRYHWKTGRYLHLYH